MERGGISVCVYSATEFFSGDGCQTDSNHVCKPSELNISLAGYS